MVAFSRSDPAFRDLKNIIAERTRPLLVWTGAGLSADAGLPSWAGLRSVLMEVGREKQASLSAEAAERLGRQLDAISDVTNAWVAFERLQEELGKAEFDAAILRELQGSYDCPVPGNYDLIWRLPLKGLVTLNLDALASRSHSAAFPGRYLNTVTGDDLAGTPDIILGQAHVLAHLHGLLEQRRSWVFTRRDLNARLNSDNYKTLMRSLLSTHVNLFLGMTVDDIAVGGFLELLKSQSVEVRNCFWYSSRNDAATDSWAGDVGVRLLRYTESPTHTASVRELLDELINARPEAELQAPPVVPALESAALETNSGDLPEPAQLVLRPLNEIRATLNAEASRILAGRPSVAYPAYEAFCSKYQEAIWRAWFVSIEPPSNLLFGYKLESAVATGAFGQVYRAIDSSGRAVAIKLLRHEIRSSPDLLQSFRRGVQSMRILSDRGVQSMVDFRGAIEIPSCVVMEWIDGANLAEAKASTTLDEWDRVLKVVVDLAKVLAEAHSLPERVLHRDLRPANVMLRNYWSDEHFEVVVLDFDLSWHVGAEQRSVQYSTALGYLAPEQRMIGKGSTRSGLVDTYGLGMTCFFLLTGTDPVPDQHLHSDYSKVLSTAADRLSSTSWSSLPARFSRLVGSMTLDAQASRPDMNEVLHEVIAMRDAHLGLLERLSPDLLVEEIAARCESFRGYFADGVKLAYVGPGRAGISMILAPDIARREVKLELDWRRTGTEERSSLGKYVGRAYDRVMKVLRDGGWASSGTQEQGQSLSVSATASLRGGYDLDRLAGAVDAASSLMSF